jgi:predicted TIM-barrel fold metal-dependent hydrolase
VSTEEVVAMVAAHPDRLIPFCNLDPRMGRNDPTTDFSHFLTYYREAGCKGVGEFMPNLPFDDPMVWNVFEHCQAQRMPVLFHIGPQVGGCYGLVDDLHLPKLEASLRRFPDLVLIGHSQPFWSEIGPDVTTETRNTYPKGKVREGGRVPELLGRCPNLYADLSANSGFNAISRDPEFGYGFLERFQDRLLFGTDTAAPDQDAPLPDYLRCAAADGHISQEAFEKIAWRNADRLLGLGLA